MKKTTSQGAKAVGGLVLAAALVLGTAAQATLSFSYVNNTGDNRNYTVSSSPAQVIPDGNPSGVAYALNFSGANQIVSVSVDLNITGGYNGDLYAYLSHGSQTLVLLDRVGVGTGSGAQYTFGYSGSSLAVTLADTGSGNIHNYGGGTPSGPYMADGQSTSPFATAGSFSSTGGSATFGNTFTSGSDPNGGWTLFFADLSSGGLSTLNSFNVNITAVPEPVTLALGLFVGMMLALWGLRRAWRPQA